MNSVTNREEKPIIIVAQDNSASILLNKDSSYYKNTYPDILNALKQELASEYTVKNYLFGETLNHGDSVSYTEKATNMALVFDGIRSKFQNRNIGALILASDGINNNGANPLYAVNHIDFPIHTIALGDTTPQRDIAIKEVRYNKLTFLGNRFPIEVYASAYECSNMETTLTVKHNGKELFSKKYGLEQESSIKETLFFNAEEVGVQHYRIAFSPVNGEISNSNNIQDIYVDVLNDKQHVLILAKHPHPDIKALRNGIEQHKNYDVVVQLFDQFDGNLDPYSMVILHQFPAVITPNLKSVVEGNTPVLYMLGSGSSISSFNQQNLGVSIAQSGTKNNEVFPVINQKFPLFSLSSETHKRISGLPPLLAPFGNFKLTKNGYSLFTQRVGNVSTDNTLLVFFNDEAQKRAVLVGEGVWRWNLQEFKTHETHDAWYELITKTVQFLSLKEDKSKFKISVKSSLYENEALKFYADLYNDSYELTNEPEVTLIIEEKSGKVYHFSFSRSINNYFLDAGKLPPGNYNYKASTIWTDKKYTSTGKFQINPLLFEANDTRANHQVLQNLSQKCNGQLFYPQEMDKLLKVIQEDPNIVSTIYEDKEIQELINWKSIFFFLMMLLSLEWFLRKRNGAY